MHEVFQAHKNIHIFLLPALGMQQNPFMELHSVAAEPVLSSNHDILLLCLRNPRNHANI